MRARNRSSMSVGATSSRRNAAAAGATSGQLVEERVELFVILRPP